jgi:hypothetical protein
VEGMSFYIGIILLLAITGLLKPIRNLTTSLGSDVDTINDVKARYVREWDIDSAVNHAKKMSKAVEKVEAIGTIHTYSQVMSMLKAQRATMDDDVIASHPTVAQSTPIVRVSE